MGDSGTKDQNYQAWELGQALGEFANALRLGFSGLIVPRWSHPPPDPLLESEQNSLDESRKYLDEMLGLQTDLALHSTDDVREEIELVKKLIDAMQPKDLPKEELAKELDTRLRMWAERFNTDLNTKSLHASEVELLGFLLAEARSYNYICLHPEGTSFWDWRQIRFTSTTLVPRVIKAADELRTVFPKDSVRAVIYSLEQWEKFRRRLVNEPAFGTEANRKNDEQFGIWRQILLDEKALEEKLGFIDRAVIIVISGLTTAVVVFCLAVVIFLLLETLGVVPDLDFLAKLDTNLKLVFSGGLAAVINWVVRQPFDAVKSVVRTWRIQTVVTKLPASLA